MNETERDRQRGLAQRQAEALREAARNLESLGLLARAEEEEEEKERELEDSRAEAAHAGSAMVSEGGPSAPAEAERPHP
jgi:hypothetical protein